jgi:hypothetical protein
MDIKKLSSLLLVTLILRTRQWNERKREKIKILKVTFDNLDLTTREAEKFWPIYNT